MKSLIYLLLYLNSLVSWALLNQDRETLYERGIHSLYAEDFNAALIYFREIEETGKTFRDSDYRLELTYLLLPENRDRSLNTILSFRDTKGKYDKFYYYWMGRIYSNRYMFREAVEAWRIFLKRKEYKSRQIVDETKRFLMNAEKMTAYFDNPNNYEIKHLNAPINSPLADIAPVYLPLSQSVIFASDRNASKKERYEIFEGNLLTQFCRPLDELGNIKPENVNIQASPSGNIYLNKGHKSGIHLSIYAANHWTSPSPLAGHPKLPKSDQYFYLSPKEDWFLFCEFNKKTGYNILEAKRSGAFAKWRDCGEIPGPINTAYDEISPYSSPDGTTLYFSSNRPGGLGGYDVYKSTYDPALEEWSEPQNLGWPINSPDDDINFSINPESGSGYFSSNRIHSIGDYDIYHFWPIQKTLVTGTVIDSRTNEPIENAEIRFHPATYLDEYFRSEIDRFGNYKTSIINNEVFKVEVIRGIDTLHKEVVTVETVPAENQPYELDIFLYGENEPSYFPPEKQVVSAKTSGPKTNAVEEKRTIKERPQTSSKVTNPSQVNISRKTKERGPVSNQEYSTFFEFSSSTLTSETRMVLWEVAQKAKKNPDLLLLISGHTDNIGTEAENMALSLKRAKNAKYWLIKAGVSPSRIETVGYGANAPLVSNDDEQDGRELNRRIEINFIKGVFPEKPVLLNKFEENFVKNE